MVKIRVWDLPVRIFHWLLAVLVIVAIVTVKIGGNALIWHFYCGYAVLSLLMFRVLWGVFGTRYALFFRFACSPAAIAAYVRDLKNGRETRSLGHNPFGSAAVLAILLILLLQVGTGLFANDDIASEGPLAKFVSKDVSDSISWVHADVNSYLIYGLIVLHIAAIAFYYFRKKEDLLTPMLSGDKEWQEPAIAAGDTGRMRCFALVLFGLCAASAYWLAGR